MLLFLCLGFIGLIFTFSPHLETVKVTGISFTSGEKVSVNVSGCVKKHGRYDVEIGTKVHDVIYMAGGITKNGDANSVDLDAVITEPCTIYVGRKTKYGSEVRAVTSDADSDGRVYKEISGLIGDISREIKEKSNKKLK